MTKKIILITGSNGEIGKSLIKELSNDNIIISLDIAHDDHISPNIKKITGSILDQNILDNINKKYNLSEIYHLAAVLSSKAQKNPDFSNEVNYNGTINLLELAKIQALKYQNPIKFFFPSSIAVYNVINQNLNDIINENNLSKNPITEYGKAKLDIHSKGKIFDGLSDSLEVWMSHGDSVTEVSDNFKIIASTKRRGKEKKERSEVGKERWYAKKGWKRN